MSIVLENDAFKAVIKEKGAELASFYNKEQNIEHIWQADPTVWGRHAPVLFPIVGQVENGEYRIENKTYQLSQHGFARDNTFQVVHSSDSCVKLSLSSNEDTLKVYPFKFELQITYTLTKNEIQTKYTVINKGDDKMFFSIGGHPGLTVPFTDRSTFNDYYLQFDEEESESERLLLDGGLLSGEKLVFTDIVGEKLKLDYSIFDQDAIILEGLNSQKVALKSEKEDVSLIFDFTGFPLLAFWTKPKANAPFLCIEPWYGIADKKEALVDYKDKKAIEMLLPNEAFNCSYSIESIS